MSAGPLTVCGLKRAYATRGEAKRAQPRSRVYLCPLGGHYHTRSPISRRQAVGHP